MPVHGLVWAFDLATRTGIAKGEPGARPWSASVILKKPGQHRAVALSNLLSYIVEQWSGDPPGLVVKEAALPLQAYRDRGNSEAGVLMAYGLHGILEAMCVRFSVPLREAHPATIRKHFIGKSKLGDRAATKAAVIARCHLLQLLPRDCHDDNRADAIATFDYACATFARHSVSTDELFLFGERASA